MIEIKEYLDAHGRSSYAQWFDRLNPQAAAKVATALIRLEQGNFSQVKGVGSGVSEYRIDFGPGYRVYFGRDGETLVILLGGGTKKRQQTDIRSSASVVARVQAAEEIGDCIMPLTQDFKGTILARVQRDPVFREELFKEGIQCLLTGDMDTGKAILRDYINATIGFAELGILTDKSAKSLMRMFSPRGNPQAKNLFEILESLQEREGVRLEVHAVKRHRRAPEPRLTPP